MAKLHSLPFVLTILFVLILASDMTDLYGNDVFSIRVLSTEKPHSSFLKKGFVFQKFCFKVKVLKTFKITYAVYVGFKMKHLRNSVFQC